jgi:hypothetical protein
MRPISGGGIDSDVVPVCFTQRIKDKKGNKDFAQNLGETP